MSKVGFWLKGSTGKLAGTTLYKGANGETIQREIVSPSNPKTLAQNIQRVVMSTVGAAYSVMKAICDHSFEGTKKGQETMSLFMSERLPDGQISIQWTGGIKLPRICFSASYRKLNDDWVMMNYNGLVVLG